MVHNSGSIHAEAVRKFQSEIFLTKRILILLKRKGLLGVLFLDFKFKGDLSMNSNNIRLAGKAAVAVALILVSAVGICRRQKSPR